MKKIVLWVIIVFVLTALIISPVKRVAYGQNTEVNYVVTDEDENFLFERIDVASGDIYIDKNFNKYQVYLVDERQQKAKARFVEKLQKPNLTKKSLANIEQPIDKKIALYLSHNDESYLIGDGTDSVYGKGGVHDVANELSSELAKKGITVFLDETLHIPHDYLAYSRSRVTATKLLANNVNAIFDIHRDGASRSTYAKTTNGVEHSTVRIVVGQANSNYEQNLELALYLLSVAESVCPWLFLDIYYAKGHYNQDLFEKALLFEMGTYTIEKEMVLETVPYLASVINTTLFQTTVDTETGDLTIGGTSSQNPTIDEILVEHSSSNSAKLFSSSVALIGMLGGTAFFVLKSRKVKNIQIKNN